VSLGERLKRSLFASSARHWTMNLLILMLFYSIFLWSVAPGNENNFIQRLEGVVYDLRLKATLDDFPATGITDVIIVDIDERSLRRIGRWPWSREVVVDLLQELQQAGVILTAMDIVFAEPEKNVVDRLLEQPLSPRTRSELQKVAPSLDVDERFAAQLSRQDVVLGYLFLPTAEERAGQLFPSDIALTEFEHTPPLKAFPGFTAPLPRLMDHAVGAGFVTIQPDADGVIRRVPLMLRYGSYVYPSLALETARQYLLTHKTGLELATAGGSTSVVAVQLDEMSIPTNRHGEVIVPYRGTTGSFRYIPAGDILEGRVFPELKNSIVLIGTSAVGLGELRTTPLEPLFPGVEIHANILDAIVNNRAFPNQPDWYPGAVMLLMLVVVILLTKVLPRLNAWLMPVVGIVILTSVTLLNFAVWKYLYLDLPLVVTALLILVLSSKEVGRGYVHEQSQRVLIKQHFDKYVPPAHIERMLAQRDSVNLDGERKEMTVLFSDIRSFTSISEGLNTSDLKLLLNLYFTPVTQDIFDHQGTVDKFVGDMVMAFWNAPLDDPDHAHHAIAAAKAMLVTTRRLRVDFERRGLPPVNIGIGINTGDMNVGDMGSDNRRNYTVLGDAVNLGARLEGLTKFYSVDLLVGHQTRDAASLWLYRHIDRVAVKGKSQAEDIFEPMVLLAEASAIQLRQCRLHNQAMELYITGHFAEAEDIFSGLAHEHKKDAYYPMILQRIAALRAEELCGWTGVFVHTSK